MWYMYMCEVYNLNFEALPCLHKKLYTHWTYLKLSLEILYKYIYAKLFKYSE